MARRIYLSCAIEERTLAEVEQLCDFLKTAGCVLEWAPAAGWDFYRLIEESIDRCDAFVAVVAEGYQSGAWLNHELAYAAGLQRLRFSPRPRLFGVSINGVALPKCSQHIALEWLDSSEKFDRPLEDLPQRAR